MRVSRKKQNTRTVAIFPEGTRTLDGKLNSFYRGFIHLLRATENDILPVTLNGFYKLKPKNRFHIHFGSRLGVVIHPPIEGQELAPVSDREIMDRISTVIESAQLNRILMINMAKNEKWIFIVNPTSGDGFGRRSFPNLNNNFPNRALDWEIVQTEKHGHASDLSEQYLKRGFTHFIAVGGDGTMNEVSKPLINKPGITLGIIPAGTGNDFIQILGFPDRFNEEHWEIFFQQHTNSMDVGYVNGKHFLNGMGLGFRCPGGSRKLCGTR